MGVCMVGWMLRGLLLLALGGQLRLVKLLVVRGDAHEVRHGGLGHHTGRRVHLGAVLGTRSACPHARRHLMEEIVEIINI